MFEHYTLSLQNIKDTNTIQQLKQNLPLLFPGVFSSLKHNRAPHFLPGITLARAQRGEAGFLGSDFSPSFQKMDNSPSQHVLAILLFRKHTDYNRKRTDAMSNKV